MGNRPKIGIVSFFIRKNEKLSWFQKAVQESHRELCDFLEKSHIDYSDTTALSSGKGIRNEADLEAVLQKLEREGVSAVLVEMTDIPPTKLFLKTVAALPVPFALLGNPHPGLKSAPGLVRGSQLIWENLSDREAVASHRLWGVGRYMLHWVYGMHALHNLKKGEFVIFSDETDPVTYANYNFILDTLGSEIVSFPVSNLVALKEAVASKKAEKLLREFQRLGLHIELPENTETSGQLIEHLKFLIAFESWLQEDSDLASPNVVAFDQAALEYLRKCDLNPAFLTTFLPVLAQLEGRELNFSVVGEAEETLLFSVGMLTRVAAPNQAFSGLIHMANQHFFMVSSPWGASAFFAGGGLAESEALANVTVQPNCETHWGLMPGFEVLTGEVTVANLARLPGGKFIMQIGEGWSREITLEMRQALRWGQSWPKIAIDLGIPPYLLIQTLGSPAVSLSMKRFAKEIQVICEQLHLPMMSLDSERELKEFRNIFRMGRMEV